jgi:hypothetical protein
LKTFHEGWTAKLTAYVELAEPIYAVWACDVLSQWHKTKALIGRQPNKKSQICFLFPLSFIFTFYFIFVILLYSFSFISTLRTMLRLKCGGRILVFFVVSKKKSKFYLLNSNWFMRIWVLCIRISGDRWKYKSNEWVCMQALKV